MTNKELDAIASQLELEDTLTKRYTVYTAECQNQEIKKLCEKISSQHKNNFESLIELLGGQ